MQRLFITGSGTGVGKTLVTAALCWQWRARKKSVAVFKPVASGFDLADPMSDPAVLLKSCELSADSLDTVSPWRFSAPLAPNLAAQREGRTLRLEDIIAFCRRQETLSVDKLLIEGVGGVMSPITDDATMLDWMAALGWPVVLVAGSYLGAVSHTLTALAALRMRSLTVQGIIVSESQESGVSLEDTVGMIEQFVSDGMIVLKLPRIGNTEEAFKYASSLNGIE